MPEPYVTSVTVDAKNIKLKVMVDDFKANNSGAPSGQETSAPSGQETGAPSGQETSAPSGQEIYVEISGQATQANGGAFANFYDVKKVPANPEADNHYYIYVDGRPVPHQFMDDDKVTVWLRVSRAWLTVLGTPDGFVAHGQRAGTGLSWNKELSVTQISGDRY